METFKNLECEAKEFIDLALNILPAFAAIGLIAMAIVELLKVIPVKLLFHRYLIRLQFGDSSYLKGLLDRLTGGAEIAFFMQRPQAITEQIASLAYYLLSFPDKDNKALIKLLATSKSDKEQPKAGDTLEEKIAGEIQGPDIDSLIGDLIDNFVPMDMDKIQIHDKCKDLLTEMIKANLTILKSRMEFWWALFLQGSSIIISAILIGYFLLRPSDISNFDLLSLVLFIFIGGLVAPVSHDLIQKIKDRRL